VHTFYLGLGCAVLACTPAPAAEPARIAVVEVDGVFHFAPATRKVKTGDILHWSNLTADGHTITPDEGFEGKLKGTNSLAREDLESTKDEYFEAINSATGQIKYHCEIHPEMMGTVDVAP